MGRYIFVIEENVLLIFFTVPLKIIVSVEPCLVSVVVLMRGCSGTVEYEAGKEKITVYSLQKTRLHRWMDGWMDGWINSFNIKFNWTLWYKQPASKYTDLSSKLNIIFSRNLWFPLISFVWTKSTMAINVRVLSLRSGIIHGFVTEPRHSRHVVFHVSVRLRGCALLSVCLVSCWSVVFWSWHSCLEFRFHEWVRTLVLHVLSCYVSVWSRVRSAGHSSVHVFCVAHSLWYYWLRAFMLCLVLCGTQLVFFIGCVFLMLSCLVWTHG